MATRSVVVFVAIVSVGLVCVTKIIQFHSFLSLYKSEKEDQTMTTVSLGKTQTNLTSLPHNKTLPSYMRETQSIYRKVILTSYHSLFFYSFSFLLSISSIMPCSLVTFLSSPSTLNEILTLLLIGMDVQLHEFTSKDFVPSVTISILKRLVVIWCQGTPITPNNGF